MSATVKLSSALPKDDANNGLDDTAAELIANPRTVMAAVIMYDVPKIVDNTDDGSRLPYVRIRRIEPLGPAKDVDPKFVTLFAKLVEQRTGSAPLPFGEDFTIEDEAAQ